MVASHSSFIRLTKVGTQRLSSRSAVSTLTATTNTSSGMNALCRSRGHRRQRLLFSGKKWLSSAATTTTTTTTTTANNNSSSSSRFDWNAAGIVFFGGMCIGTFGLGCWQSQRYFEKQGNMDERNATLEKEPIRELLPSSFVTASTESGKKKNKNNFQRIELRGTFDYDREVFVGPRGLPQGYLPEKNAGAGSSNMNSAKGYFVVTPFRIHDDQDNNNDDDDRPPSFVMINRGWIPMDFVHDSRKKMTNKILWERPNSLQTVTVLPSKLEEPKFFKVENNNNSNNNNNNIDSERESSSSSLSSSRIIFHMDETSFSNILRSIHDKNNDGAKNGNNNDDVVLLCTQVLQNETDEKKYSTRFPLQPSKHIVSEYTITPAVHAGYATTWFGLSASGIVMTRKLFTRGR